MKLDKRAIEQFQQKIWNFYKKNKREFPWRWEDDPYRILVSEFMLQQTQTERVKDKYILFLKNFPDFKALANASVSEVLSIWQGLGYNRRALFLKRLSEIVMREYAGKLPNTKEELLRLPGIGKYTVGAILAFAFQQPVVCIETNIRRVFIHEFFSDKQGISDAEIEELVGVTLDKENPREWYYALMDYGAKLASLKENPNKKSKHYTIQSKFEGSVRQVRGQIVKILLQHGSLPKDEIIHHLKNGDERLEKAVAGLIKDGFIKEENGTFSVI